MTDLILGVIIGLLVGWNFLPQPKWVSDIWAKVKGWIVG